MVAGTFRLRGRAVLPSYFSVMRGISGFLWVIGKSSVKSPNGRFRSCPIACEIEAMI